MIQITDNAKEQQLIPLFRFSFSPFFLVGAVFSVISVLVWSLILIRKMTLPSLLPMSIWYGHEMLFGFPAAIFLGFLITAVQNCTR